MDFFFSIFLLVSADKYVSRTEIHRNFEHIAIREFKKNRGQYEPNCKNGYHKTIRRSKARHKRITEKGMRSGFFVCVYAESVDLISEHDCLSRST